MAVGDFIKKNVAENVQGTFGKGFLALDVANLVTSQNKLKSLLTLMKDLIIIGPLMSATFASAFFGMGKAVRALVHDTGSLDAALRKLSQIQALQKTFTTITGGAQAAKLKVAELVNFAASRNIKLGDAAEASRSLSIMTRNSFSSAHALDAVNDAAKATGNSVTDVADAVGAFSVALREGDSIEGVTERLREMGIISDVTADKFLRLQKNGATSGQIFGALTASLATFTGGAKEAEASIDGVNEAFEKAKTNLQEKFGSPFVEADVKNTKNYTAAANAVAPAVSRLGKFFQVLTGSMSEAKSKTVEIAASWSVVRVALEGLIYVVSAAITVISVLGANSLAKWFLQLSKSIEVSTKASILSSAAMNTLGKGLSFVGVSGERTESILQKTSGAMSKLTGITSLLARGLSLLPAVAIGVELGSIVYKWINSFEEAAIALQNVQKGQNQVASATRAEIANIHSLAQKHVAVANALKKELEAREALAAAIAKGDKKEIEAAESAMKLAETMARMAIASKTAGPEPEQAAYIKMLHERAVAEKEARYQAAQGIAKPAEKITGMETHGEELKKKIAMGEAGEKAIADFSARKSQADIDVTTREGGIANLKNFIEQSEKKLPPEPSAPSFGTGGQYYQDKVKAREEALKELEAAKRLLSVSEQDLKIHKEKQALVGETAPVGSSVAIQAQIRKEEAGNDPLKAKNLARLQQQLNDQLQVEKETGANRIAKIEEDAALKAAKREQTLGKLSVENETARQEAQLKGDNKAMTRLDDMSVFTEKYQEMRDKGFTEEEAKTGAAKFADTAVSISSKATAGEAVSSIVADSLTKVGGGGGVYAPTGGDPMLTAAQRQVALHEAEVEYLKVIAGASDDKGGVL